ncbi:murein biosynthesis integral membrane protein MurJ [Herbaspirillum sp. GCM10030257]|uniref:murein biosynthesis integral membrane protein MurJ n=1 Tax=Herbaspirillum sp. GCM10030257 TaxID=3273393 RepID=UPI0036229C77
MKLLMAVSNRVKEFHPDHHAVFKGMTLVVLFLFVGKFLGAAKEMAVAYRYGVGPELDAYLFVFNIMSWAVSIWFTVVGVVIVPLWARVHGDGSLSRFRAELLGLTLIFGATLALLFWIVLPLLLSSSLVTLPSNIKSATIRMVPVFILLAPLGAATSLFSTWILADGKHIGTLLEGVPAIAIGISVLMFASGDIDVLVWGTVAGSALYLICLAATLARRKALEAPRFTRHSEHWPLFWKGFGIMALGQACMNVISIMDQLFAVRLGPGAVATLSYSDRITALLLSLGGIAISRATLPVFSKAQSRGDGQVYGIARQWTGLMFAAGVLVALLAWAGAPYGVRLLFQRGAFTEEDAVTVTTVFCYGLLQIPFFFAGLVLISNLLSLGLHHWVAKVGITLFIIKVIGNYLLVPVLGIKGIAVATAVMYVFSFTILWALAAYAHHTNARV